MLKKIMCGLVISTMLSTSVYAESLSGEINDTTVVHLTDNKCDTNNKMLFAFMETNNGLLLTGCWAYVKESDKVIVHYDDDPSYKSYIYSGSIFRVIQ